MKNLLVSKLTRERLEKFLERHASNAHTLDIGCANSPYACLFPNRIGLDVAPAEGVDVVGDAHALPFEDKTFERVLCTEVLEHLHTPERALEEIYRVLKPGGMLILTTRFAFPLHDAPGDFFRYSKYGLAHLLRGFEDVQVEEEATSFGTLGILLQRIALQSDLRGGKLTKAIFLLVARGIGALQWMVKQEYGKRKPSATLQEKTILTSGYYVLARRPKG